MCSSWPGFLRYIVFYLEKGRSYTSSTGLTYLKDHTATLEFVCTCLKWHDLWVLLKLSIGKNEPFWIESVWILEVFGVMVDSVEQGSKNCALYNDQCNSHYTMFVPLSAAKRNLLLYLLLGFCNRSTQHHTKPSYQNPWECSSHGATSPRYKLVCMAFCKENRKLYQ